MFFSSFVPDRISQSEIVLEWSASQLGKALHPVTYLAESLAPAHVFGAPLQRAKNFPRDRPKPLCLIAEIHECRPAVFGVASEGNESGLLNQANHGSHGLLG